jgi:hypothetical protein
MVASFRFFTLLIIASLCQSQAADRYVSTSGNDANAGTITAPWRTIQKAANSAKPGDVVNIRSGIYKELVQITVSGTAAARIVFRSAPGELAVLDATGLKLPSYEAPLIRLADRDYVTIQGLELRNVITSSDLTVPMGIFIDNSGTGIEIRNCKIHDIQQNNAVKYNSNANGHAIAAYGRTRTAISGLVIDGCDIYSLRLGASESVVLNGNVTGFKVTNNMVHDANNIGIDFIGYEGTNRDAALDRARDGICSGNKVWNITSANNPAYGGDFTRGGGDRGSDGIYVDGGTRIIIERNEVWNCDIGVELASEHGGKATDFITVRNNVIRQNIVTGLSLGGYNKTRGSTVNCTITNNTLVLNDTAATWSGQIQLQYNISNCVIKNNIIQASPTTRQMIVHSPRTALGTGNVIDYNLYYCTTGSALKLEFDLAGKSYTTLAKWQQASAFDQRSFFAIPGFANAAANKYDLAAGSAAIDKGDPKYVPATAEKDFNGRSRLAGRAVDIGAVEYGAK